MRLRLLRAFDLSVGGTDLCPPLGSQRLLALLALRRGGTQRGWAAEQLWPDCTSSRAAGNLRCALCHVRRASSAELIDSVGRTLRLASAVQVDLHHVSKVAGEVIAGERTAAEVEASLVDDLCLQLLPDWAEDWLVIERERWNAVRLHALESLAQQLATAHHYVPALQTALSATAIDPVRETAHRIVMYVHITEGNTASAYKHYQEYREFLRRELNVSPSPRMTRLAEDLS